MIISVYDLFKAISKDPRQMSFNFNEPVEPPPIQEPPFDALEIMLRVPPTPKATTPTITTPPKQPRYFIRCPHCLGISVIESATEPYNLHCSTCGTGKPEIMGRVSRDRLVKDEKRVPCDHRCTNARGPSCNCQCGGENHGTGMMITITHDAGGIPTVQTSGDAEKAKIYLDRRNRVRGVLEEKLKDQPRFMPRELYDINRFVKSNLSEASKARTWKSREKYLHDAEHLLLISDDRNLAKSFTLRIY